MKLVSGVLNRSSQPRVPRLIKCGSSPFSPWCTLGLVMSNLYFIYVYNSSVELL